MTDSDEVKLLRALKRFVYEATHLSPAEDDGSHWCKISAEALAEARTALDGYTRPPVVTDEVVERRVAEIRHWFFQTLTPEQRSGFFYAWAAIPKDVTLSLGMQYQALERIARRAQSEEDKAHHFATMALAATGRGPLSAEEVEAEMARAAIASMPAVVSGLQSE